MRRQKQQEIVKLYADLMQESKGRLSCIDYALSGSMDAFPVIARREFYYLQFRFIFEIIALACLVAHGDMTEASKLKKMWSAQEIMNALEKLNPDFYPKPVKKTELDGGIHLAEVTEGYLLKGDLLKLYGKAGDILHKGSLKNILKPKNSKVEDFLDVKEYKDAIVTLLDEHRIALYGGKYQLLCLMGDYNQLVQVAMASTEPMVD